MAAYPPGPSSVGTGGLPAYGANSAPTDRMYIASAAVGFTPGSAADFYITPNDFLAEITRNITDKGLSFGGGSVATVSAANKGKLAYDEVLQKFKYSENGGAYKQWLEPAGVTGSVQINNGAGFLDGDAKFIYDTATATVIIGSSAGVGSLKFRGTGVTSGVTFKVSVPTGNNVYTLPDALPTLNQFLQATAVSGVNVTLGWGTATAVVPGAPTTSVQFNNAGAFAGDAALTWVSPVLTVGTASTTTGQITFAVSGSANTQSFQAGTAPAASNTYRWPNASPTANQILAASAPSGGIVTLSWVTNVSPNAPNFSVQINGGGGNFDSNGQFTYDTVTSTVIIGSSSALGSLKFRDTTTSNGVTFQVNAPSGNNVYTLPDALPTLNQVLTATAVSGVNVTLGWSTPAAAVTPGTPVNSVQFNNPLGTFAGDAGLLYIAGSTTGNRLALASSTITSGNLFSIAMTGTAATANTKTGLNITSSGANGTASQTVFGQTISVTNTGTANTNKALSITASGGSTANIAIESLAGSIVQTSNLAAAFESGPNGSTNPVFRLVNSTASQADGVSIAGLAAGSGTTFTAISSGSNSPLTLTPKGTGVITTTANSQGDALFLGATYYFNTTGGGPSLTISQSSNRASISLVLSTRSGGGSLSVSSNGYIGFLASTAFSESSDGGFVRAASAVIRVCSGTTSTIPNAALGSLLIANSSRSVTGNFTVIGDNAATATAIDVARLGLTSTGTPAAGFGGVFSFSLQSSTTADQQAANQQWFWTTAAHASRTAALSWSLVNNATVSEYMRLAAPGPASATYLAIHAGTAPNVWTSGALAAKLYLIDAAGTPATGVAANFSTTSNAGPTWQMLRGRGTNASPVAVNNGDVLGELQFAGYHNTSTNNFANGALIRATTMENWSTGVNGTSLYFFVAPAGGTLSATENMSLRSTGTLRLNASSGSFDATTLLQVGNYGTWNLNVTAAIYTAANGVKGLQVIGTNGQTANLFEVYKDAIVPNLFNVTSVLGTQVRAGLGTNAADYAYVGGCLKTNTTSVSNVGSTATDLITYSLRANSLGTNADAVEIDAWGTFDSTVAAKEVILYFGTDAIYATGAFTFQNDSWRIRARVVRTGAATQISVASFDGNFVLVTDNAATAAPTQTLSSAVTIKCTGQGTASDQISQLGLNVKWIPAGQ